MRKRERKSRRRRRRRELKISGTTKIQLRLPNRDWEEVMAVVIPKLSDDFLLSWYSQILLKILLKDWLHKNNKILCAQMCPQKLYFLVPPETVALPDWPPEEWDSRFTLIISK